MTKDGWLRDGEGRIWVNKIPEPININKAYLEWCTETKRNGGVLVGGSIKEFFIWLENNYEVAIKKKS